MDLLIVKLRRSLLNVLMFALIVFAVQSFLIDLAVCMLVVNCFVKRFGFFFPPIYVLF